MKRLLLFVTFVFLSSACYADVQWVPVNQPELIVQEQFVPPANIVVQPAPQIVPQKPLVKKIKWVLTPNVTFAEAPYYTRGVFGGLVLKKQIVLHTTWVWTPVEVWE